MAEGNTLISDLMMLVEQEDDTAIRQLVAGLSESELAQLLAAVPPLIRHYTWHLIDPQQHPDVLEALDDGVRSSLLNALPQDSAVTAASYMEQSELADVLLSVPEELADAILRSLSTEERNALQARLLYPSESAGRYMSDQWIAIRSDVKLETVGRFLKRLNELPPHTDALLVTDRTGQYQGRLRISKLLTSSDDLLVSELMESHEQHVTIDTQASVFAPLFEQWNVESIAVIDDEGTLVGRITIDDALDIIREQADHQVMNMAGLDDNEDLFAPIIPSAKRRMFWLGINLGTAFLAAWVIGLFEATLDQIVALAVLMPIVASMGGIAGSQTLTLAIRGLALGQITQANTRWLAIKEITIAGINGILWAVVVGALAWLWFNDVKISLVLAAAMIINQFAAAVSGISVPLILNRLGIDPALSGSVILTTVTDVVGFMSFLGLATIILI